MENKSGHVSTIVPVKSRAQKAPKIHLESFREASWCEFLLFTRSLWNFGWVLQSFFATSESSWVRMLHEHSWFDYKEFHKQSIAFFASKDDHTGLLPLTGVWCVSPFFFLSNTIRPDFLQGKNYRNCPPIWFMFSEWFGLLWKCQRNLLHCTVEVHKLRSQSEETEI